MMWTALAIRLFVVINRTVCVTFRTSSSGVASSVHKPLIGSLVVRKAGNCGFNKDRFRYVAEERNFATADVGSWHIASVSAVQRHVWSWGKTGSNRTTVKMAL